MGQAVKYAALALALATLLVLFGSYISQVPVSSAAGRFSFSVVNLLNHVSPYLSAAKGFLNLLFGYSELVTFCLWYVLLMPFAKWTIHIVSAVYHFINK